MLLLGRGLWRWGLCRGIEKGEVEGVMWGVRGGCNGFNGLSVHSFGGLRDREVVLIEGIKKTRGKDEKMTRWICSKMKYAVLTCVCFLPISCFGIMFSQYCDFCKDCEICEDCKN